MTRRNGTVPQPSLATSQIIISFFLRERSLFSQRTFSTDLSGFLPILGFLKSFHSKESTVFCWIFFYLFSGKINKSTLWLHQTPNSLGVYEALITCQMCRSWFPFQVILSSSEEDKIKRTGIEDRLLKHREILESVYLEFAWPDLRGRFKNVFTS